MKPLTPQEENAQTFPPGKPAVRSGEGLGQRGRRTSVRDEGCQQLSLPVWTRVRGRRSSPQGGPRAAAGTQGAASGTDRPRGCGDRGAPLPQGAEETRPPVPRRWLAVGVQPVCHTHPPPRLR